MCESISWNVDSKAMCIDAAEEMRNKVFVVPMVETMRDLGLLLPEKKSVPMEARITSHVIDIPTDGLLVIHLASLLGIKCEELIKHFAKKGITVAYNQRLEASLAVTVAGEFGVDATINGEAHVVEVSGETALTSVADDECGIHRRLPTVEASASVATGSDGVADTVIQTIIVPPAAPQRPASSESTPAGTPDDTIIPAVMVPPMPPKRDKEMEDEIKAVVSQLEDDVMRDSFESGMSDTLMPPADEDLQEAAEAIVAERHRGKVVQITRASESTSVDDNTKLPPASAPKSKKDKSEKKHKGRGLSPEEEELNRFKRQA